MITLRETITKSKSDDKTQWEKYDPLTYYLERPLSYLFTWPLINIGVTANQTTFISIIFSFISLLLMSFGDTKNLKIIGWVFMFLWSIFDGVDGNIARSNQSASKTGELWDAAAGYIAMSFIYLSAGFMSLSENILIFNKAIDYKIIIFISSLSIIDCLVPRIIMHKKARFDSNTDFEFKNRKSFGLLKLIINNIMSITGIGLFSLLIAIIFDFCYVYTLVYFVFNTLIAIYSLIVLLKKK